MEGKAESIAQVLRRLRQDLGADSFVVVDHWDADMCAVGVARPDDPRYLVYISTFPDDGSLAFERERPPVDDDFPYDSDGLVEGATYDELAAAVRDHVLGTH